MALAKEDLKQIGKVVDRRVGLSEKRLGKKIEDEVANLATMTKRGFDGVDKRFEAVDKGFDKIERDLKLIRDDISHLAFIATEMVRRDELTEVKQRLSQIEAKLGLAKTITKIHFYFTLTNAPWGLTSRFEIPLNSEKPKHVRRRESNELDLVVGSCMCISGNWLDDGKIKMVPQGTRRYYLANLTYLAHLRPSRITVCRGLQSSKITICWSL